MRDSNPIIHTYFRPTLLSVFIDKHSPLALLALPTTSHKANCKLVKIEGRIELHVNDRRVFDKETRRSVVKNIEKDEIITVCYSDFFDPVTPSFSPLTINNNAHSSSSLALSTAHKVRKNTYEDERDGLCKTYIHIHTHTHT